MADEFEEELDAALPYETYEELSESTDAEHGYSLKQLKELKQSGFPKPAEVPWTHWNAPFKLSPRQELIVYLAAQGFSGQRIASEIGLSYNRTMIILSNPSMRALIAMKQKEIYGNQPKERLRLMTAKALDTLENVLDNEQEKSALRTDVAKYVIDQGVGKATQPVEVSGNLLSELIVRLDNEKSRDITDSAKKLDKPADPLEAFVEAHVPSDVKVGARGASEE